MKIASVIALAALPFMGSAFVPSARPVAVSVKNAIGKCTNDALARLV